MRQNRVHSRTVSRACTRFLGQIHGFLDEAVAQVKFFRGKPPSRVQHIAWHRPFGCGGDFLVSIQQLQERFCGRAVVFLEKVPFEGLDV